MKHPVTLVILTAAKDSVSAFEMAAETKPYFASLNMTHATRRWVIRSFEILRSVNYASIISFLSRV
jgi:hypothetical protein